MPPPARKTDTTRRRVLPPLDEQLWDRLRGARRCRGAAHVLGRHGAHYKGFAAQFSEYRPYVPGDDPRFIDHRLQARTDRDYVKLARLESALRCLFVLDATRSMAPAGDADKLAWACRAVWMGASVLDRMGDSTALAVCGRDDPLVVAFGRGRAHIDAMRAALETLPPHSGVRLPHDLAAAADQGTAATLALVISDFVAPLAPLLGALDRLADTRVDMVLVHILTTAERTFPFTGTVLLHDPETAAELVVSADELREAYTAHVASRGAALDRFARDRGHLLISVDPAHDSEAAVWEQVFRRHGGEDQW